MLTRFKPKLIAVWVVFGILLPAVLSHFSGKTIKAKQGVLFRFDQGSFHEDSFQSALSHLPVRKGGAGEISAHVWSAKQSSYLLALKGNGSCILQVDGRTVLEKKQTYAAAQINVPRGFSQWKLRVPLDPYKTPLLFSWSSDYVTAEEIPSRVCFTEMVSQSTILTGRVGRALGIVSRLNVMILLLWIAVRLAKVSFRKKHLFWLAALVCMLWLRVAGIGYQMEEGIHPDEKMYGVMIDQVRSGRLAPTQFWYTTGYFFITTAAHETAEWVMGEALPQNGTQRIISAMASWFTCLAVFSIGETLLSYRAAILATLFFGFSFMPVELAHFGIVEPAMVFFFVFALALLVKAMQHRTVGRFAAAGFVAGIAVAVKQTAAVIGLPFGVAVILLLLKKETAREAIRGAGAWIAAALLGFLVFSPATILDFWRFYQYQLMQMRSLHGETDTHLFFLGADAKFGILVWRALHSAVGYPMLAAAALGLFTIWRQSRTAGLLLVPVTIVYLIVFARVATLPEHYVLILCPLVALLAAATIDAIPLSQQAERMRNTFLAVVAVFLLMPSLLNIFTLQKLLHGTDTRRQASEWCYKNLKPGSRIDYEIFGPRFLVPVLDAKRVVLFRRPAWEVYTRQKRSEYYAEDSITRDVFFAAPASFPVEMHWYQSWEKQGNLVQEFHGQRFRLLNPDIRIFRRVKSDAPLPSLHSPRPH